MKGKKYLLAGLVFGLMLGWALGFLRLPYLEKNFSFLVGFIAALAFASLLFILLTAWNRNFLPGLPGKKTEAGSAANKRALTLIWIALSGVLVLGVVVSGFTIYRRIGSFKLQIQNQDKKLLELAAVLEFVKKQNQEPLIRSVLDDVGKELQRNPGRTLRDTTIARIAALSSFFKPYQYIEGDSLSESAYSPERGQLLQALILMQLDSGAFGRIKRKVLFAGADLRGADLKGLDLSGINFREANLKNADLSSANLSGADLGGANLWGANLNQANLGNADLKRADLRWAQMNKATLRLANLNGAKLANAQLKNADLFDASVQWAQSDGALFNEANLTSVNFLGTNLTKVNFHQANLVDADLRRIDLSEADLLGVRLNKALVDKDWGEKLKKWQPNGERELQESYIVVNDTFDKWKIPMFRLKKME